MHNNPQTNRDEASIESDVMYSKAILKSIGGLLMAATENTKADFPNGFAREELMSSIGWCINTEADRMQNLFNELADARFNSKQTED